MLERSQHGNRRIHAGDQVRHNDANFLRPAAGLVVWVAGDCHQTCHALKDRVVAGQLAIGACLTKASDAAVNKPGVDG